MNADNGKGRILLHNRRPMGKGGDFVTRTELEQFVTAECAKVHEHYLNQIPKFTAQMIQDALVGYGILTLTPPATDAPAVPENAGIEPAAPDSVTPAGAPCGDEPSAEPVA